MKLETCTWSKRFEHDFDGSYETSCDNIFCFNEGNIIDNGFSFCPFCGKYIKEV